MITDLLIEWVELIAAIGFVAVVYSVLKAFDDGKRG